MDLPTPLRTERYCTLSTTSRISGRRHTAELWFVPAEGGIHLLSGSGGLTQWWMNLEAAEQGVVRLAGRAWLARASFLGAADPLRDEVLAAFHDKYDPASTDRRDEWRPASLAHLVLGRELFD